MVEKTKRLRSQSQAPKDIVHRNLELVGVLMRYMISRPDILQSLPEKFELVILPEDDPDIRRYNLDLLDRFGSEGKQIVFARIRTESLTKTKNVQPSLYVPVAT